MTAAPKATVPELFSDGIGCLANCVSSPRPARVANGGNLGDAAAAGEENSLGCPVAQDRGVKSDLAFGVDRGDNRLCGHVEAVKDAANRRRLASSDDPLQRRRCGRRALPDFWWHRVGQAGPQHARPQHQRGDDGRPQTRQGALQQQSGCQRGLVDLWLWP